MSLRIFGDFEMLWNVWEFVFLTYWDFNLIKWRNRYQLLFSHLKIVVVRFSNNSQSFKEILEIIKITHNMPKSLQVSSTKSRNHLKSSTRIHNEFYGIPEKALKNAQKYKKFPKTPLLIQHNKNNSITASHCHHWISTLQKQTKRIKWM